MYHNFLMDGLSIKFLRIHIIPEKAIISGYEPKFLPLNNCSCTTFRYALALFIWLLLYPSQRFIIVVTRSQNRDMNDATAQQLAQAIQALATAAAAAPPPPAAPAAIPPPVIPDHISPYEGNALDLSSQTGTSLFQKGSEALASKFTGKVEDLHLFLADL